MTSLLPLPPVPNNNPLRIGGKLAELPLWLWTGFVSLATLFILKGIQGCLEGNANSPMSFLVYSVAHRITNVSLWFVIFGWISIWIIVGFVQDWIKVGRLWTNGIELNSRWAVFALLLSLVEIGLYVAAVYRDGGTFFILVTWGRDRAIPVMGIYAIQVIEGLLFCVLLVIMSFWAAVAHAAYSETRLIGPGGYKELYERTINQILWMTLFPFFAFLGLSTCKIVLDWQTGIPRPFYAMGTAFFMWIAFGWLFLRVMLDPRNQMEGSFALPWFKIVSRKATSARQGVEPTDSHDHPL